MNRTRYIPSIVMLAAALVTCLTTMYFDYETKDILLLVLAVSVVFLLIGYVIKFFTDKYLIIETLTEVQEEEKQEDTEGNVEDKDNNDQKEL